MNKIDLIIEAIRLAEYHVKAKGWGDDIDLELYTEALAAARELKDELYAKEMEQPTPKQSGKMSITALRLDEVKHD
jgi:hypothetical protein